MLTCIDTVRLEDIPFIDRPDIELPSASNAENGMTSSESVSMPFKYIMREDGTPIMPEVSSIYEDEHRMEVMLTHQLGYVRAPGQGRREGYPGFAVISDLSQEGYAWQRDATLSQGLAWHSEWLSRPSLPPSSSTSAATWRDPLNSSPTQ